jgi:hypothetical protein
MNEAGAKAASSEDEADGVHRLRDIVVEEVSLVDRAANFGARVRGPRRAHVAWTQADRVHRDRLSDPDS